jgi:uncharacterized protein
MLLVVGSVTTVSGSDGSEFMSEEFLCARCAKHTTTCCQDTDIYVTLGDVRRITPHAKGQPFTEFRPPAYPVYDQQLEDPFWHQHVFREDGQRRVLKHQSNKDCFFLGEQGCVLPADARPSICRLYPFDYNADGILPRLASGCPVELLRPDQSLIVELQMDAEHAEQLRRRLYVEMTEKDAEQLKFSISHSDE